MRRDGARVIRLVEYGGDEAAAAADGSFESHRAANVFLGTGQPFDKPVQTPVVFRFQTAKAAGGFFKQRDVFVGK